jgi:hypothetical protein
MKAYQRATASYDAHEEALVEAITRAMFEASVIGEPPVPVLRIGELTDASLNVLAATLALSSELARSPAAIRKTTDILRRRLPKRVANARGNSDFQDFKNHCFRHDDPDRPPERRSGGRLPLRRHA